MRRNCFMVKLSNWLFVSGHPCVDNTDCAPSNMEGEPLCCQEIRRYRQKPKRICDTIRPISTCIAANMQAKHPGK